MIRVRKPTPPPAILKNKGEPKRKAHCDDYAKSPGDYRSGAKSFDHDSKVYNAKSVKNALLKAQHCKCCYCEWKATPGSFGDVEHFRPKAGYQQTKGDSLGRPGYYWLAYEWSNLYLSCQVCNQQFKKNHFPLADDTNRARCHDDDIGTERPLIIDPGGEVDPAEFIGFRDEVPYAIDGNLIGRITIELLGLDRPGLMESRRDLLATIKLLRDNRDLLKAESTKGRSSPEADDLLARLDTALAGCVREEFPYASMARFFLA